MSVAYPAAPAARFMSVYARLVFALAVLWVGGWVALLLYARGDGIAALTVLIGSTVVSGERAGILTAGITLAEAVALVMIALRLPLLAYVWADTAPLSLVAVLVVQAPIALAVTWLSRG